MLRSIATKIMVSYVRASMGANVAAIVAVSVAIGVLAAVINTRSAVQGTEVGEAVTVNLATNAAISWTIASLFCIPQIVGRAFRKFDYFLGCLHLVGWPARRSCQMLSM
ncbi:hypothetical protein C3B44_07855 [Corynebacterium yudongzhengii]|uniref:Uncharacterized protein n=1 Tax=Corynebacterium yudongzhengii TaxID=2080740 RepID=A0A2U1T7X2_9CORY|nr:hypothetical protein [Corynebacterium yudongzhengii]AWB82277.1 hypothetical protein C3B44_07855 [Corynebacterium yudongzhengii]PWC02104.1 hypothetical protein DF222_04525 [Corynebacterium yudongzhengii]